MRDEHASTLRDGLERVADRIEAFDSDHAFVLGDLIEDGDSDAVDRENVRLVRSILESRSFPVTYLLGNHDVKNLDRAALSELLDQDSFHGLVDVEGTPVVSLDSSWEAEAGARGQLGTRQRAWLGERLRDVSDALVLVHHPIGGFDLADNPWFAEFPERAFLGDRKESLELFGETGAVRATLSGHVHQTGLVQSWGLPHVSLDAFSKAAPNVPFTGTYAELTVDDDGVEIDVQTPEGATASYTIE